MTEKVFNLCVKVKDKERKSLNELSESDVKDNKVKVKTLKLFNNVS